MPLFLLFQKTQMELFLFCGGIFRDEKKRSSMRINTLFLNLHIRLRFQHIQDFLDADIFVK